MEGSHERPSRIALKKKMVLASAVSIVPVGVGRSWVGGMSLLMVKVRDERPAEYMVLDLGIGE